MAQAEKVREKPEQDVTVLLARWTGGDEAAFEELLALLYGELRHLAASLMRGQPAGHTLQATALIHEVYLKLAGRQELSFVNRSAFLGLAAKAMRRILVDHARARAAAKRGGDDLRVTLVDGLLGRRRRSRPRWWRWTPRSRRWRRSTRARAGRSSSNISAA